MSAVELIKDSIFGYNYVELSELITPIKKCPNPFGILPIGGLIEWRNQNDRY